MILIKGYPYCFVIPAVSEVCSGARSVVVLDCTLVAESVPRNVDFSPDRENKRRELRRSAF